MDIMKYIIKYGYFKKCVKYLKKKVVSPVFVFFCLTQAVSRGAEKMKMYLV